jgi:hypothetical protein
MASQALQSYMKTKDRSAASPARTTSTTARFLDMPREDFLCSATATDLNGVERKFTVYKITGQTFKIYNDRGHNHVSHVSRKVNGEDIKREIITVYDVSDVILTGSIRQGVLSSTWPLRCRRCFNCECEPTRRRYGGRFGGQGYCAACFGVIARRDAAKTWDRDRPETWHHVYLDQSTIENSYSAEEFEIYRNEFIRQAELRLAHLREAEGKRRGKIPVDGADIERLRATLLEGIRRKAKLSPDRQYIEDHFNTEQRQRLYVLLADLVECIQWKFPWWRGMEAVSEHIAEMSRR